MQKVIITILVISIIANIILGYILYNNKKSNERDFDPSVYVEKIDSLESEISFLDLYKDSIQNMIDTVFVEIRVNNNRYEKVYNTIIANTVNDDYIFFSTYIQRYDSINNF